MPKLTTIEEIRAHQWAGNFHSDCDAFRACDNFTRNKENSIADRAEASRIAARTGMGLEGKDAGDHLTDEEFVKEFEEMDEGPW